METETISDNGETLTIINPTTNIESESRFLTGMTSSAKVKLNFKQQIFKHSTTTAHICIILYVFTIVFLCFTEEFAFFTWHPLLMSLGWTFLMSEAILVISQDNIIAKRLSRKLRVRWHWILQTIALALILVAFIVVVVNKNRLNKAHFKSWHGVFGLVAVIFSIPTCANGTAALFHVNLRHYIKPKWLKLVHIGSGIVTATFGGASLVLSVYTMWFTRKTGGHPVVFVVNFVLIGVAVVWTVVRPIVSFSNHVKHILL